METVKNERGVAWSQAAMMIGVFVVGFAAFPQRGWTQDNVNVSSLIRPYELSLNGDWHFREDPKNTGETERWFKPGTVRGRLGAVPLPWQLAFPDLREYLGTAWYEKDFIMPQEYRKKRVAIQFLGVDYSSRIWVNGELVGDHAGDLTPFTIDITKRVKFGEKNTVTLRVTDPEAAVRWWSMEQLNAFSGLWRDVYLEITGEPYVSDVYMVPNIDRSEAEARVEVFSTTPTKERKLTVRVDVKAPDGENFRAENKIHLPKNDISFSTRANIPLRLGKSILWELDNPALYEAHVSVIDEQGETIDSATTHFGMRKIETRGKHIFLNNKPVYLMGGWLDTSPLGGADEVNWALPPPYKPLSDEEIKRDIKLAKSLGINTVRRLLRSVNPRFLYWADRLGLLVWEGGPWVPPQGIASRKILDQYKQEWRDIVARDRNHPSVIIWELFAEDIGVGAGEFRSWSNAKKMLEELYDHLKSLDGSRLVLDNAAGRSPYTINYIGNHGKTDFDDVNYLGAAAESWIQGVDVFREYCAQITEHGKPVTNSLLHNISSRIFDADRARQKWGGKTPWWFTTPPGIVFDSAAVTGYEERFYKWGFDEIYGNFTRFTEDSDWYQYEGMKYQAEEMRKNPDISGYFSFLYDTAPHVIGWVDIFREKKVFADELRKINSADLILLDLRKRNFWSQENVQADLSFSHFGAGDAKGCVVKWRLEGFKIQGEVNGISVESGDVKKIGQIRFKTPEVNEAQTARLDVRFECNGKLMSQNYVDILIFPLQYRESLVRTINLYGGLAWPSRFDILGYEYGDGLDPRIPVAVATKMDDKVRAYLSAGGTVLLLICEELDLIYARAEPKIHPAEGFLSEHGLALGGKEFHGGITGSHFIKRSQGLFDRIPFKNPIAWPFYKAIPQRVIIGMKPEDRSDILAGAYGSFLKNTPQDSAGNKRPCEVTATLVQFQYGKGRLIISTFDLLKPLADDPVATIMLNDLVRYASGNFLPHAKLVVQ